MTNLARPSASRLTSLVSKTVMTRARTYTDVLDRLSGPESNDDTEVRELPPFVNYLGYIYPRSLRSVLQGTRYNWSADW